MIGACGGESDSAPRPHPPSRSLACKVKIPLKRIRGKLHDSSFLFELKVGLVHKKHQLGKFANIINANHRHDEEHEKKADEKRSKIAASHRYASFAPERFLNNIKWYVDGRNYFHAVSVALERAQETIYIADWWLSPELFLRRPPHSNQEWRLDYIFKRKAEAGVKIFVIVYREVEAALTCNSLHTKRALKNLCPRGTKGHGNIVVMRHPDHNVLENAADMTFYWAHHEKFIVIDYNIAFIGGLDLCFGRWDNHQHPLADLYPGVNHETWPGQDFNNNRVMDFQNVGDWKSNALSKTEYGRMPWHDVAMGIIGDCVYDIAEHFVLRWNFIKRDKYKRNHKYDWLMLEGRQNSKEDLVGIQRPKYPVGHYILHPISDLDSKKPDLNPGTVHAQIIRSSSDWSSGILTEHSIQNAYSDLIRNAEHYVYIENQFFITATGEDQAPIKNTIGSAIVDAVVRADREGRSFRIIALIPAVPGFAGDLRENAAISTRAIMNYQYQSICRGSNSIFGRIKAQGVDPEKYIFFFNLRCYDRLNVTPGIKRQESESGVKHQEVQRADALEIMGKDNHSSKNPFKFAASYLHRKKSNAEAQEVTSARQKFQQRSNVDGPSEAPVGNGTISKYAMLYSKSLSDVEWEGGLEEEVDHWIQEELYIHSKLLIIDDKTVVCGSSNINDRSQLGYHDSELGIVMTDTKTIRTTMDGKPYEAGYHAATLRRYLWREHLGLLPPQELDASKDPNAQPPDVDLDPLEDSYFEFVADPLSNELWEMWKARATKNTEIFREVFHADPDDCVKTFEDYEKFLSPKGVKSGHVFDRKMPPHEVRAKLDQVKGHLVWMPMEFLVDAQMAEPGLQINSWTESIYT